MTEAMSVREFKYGLLSLADDGPGLINERLIARLLAAAYIDADEDAQRDCSEMLRQDLVSTQQCQHDFSHKSDGSPVKYCSKCGVSFASAATRQKPENDEWCPQCGADKYMCKCDEDTEDFTDWKGRR